MARIPLGNFGNMVAEPQRRARVIPEAFDTGAGLQQVGDKMMGVASMALREQRQQDEALTRAKAANAMLDREIQVKDVTAGIERDIAENKLHYSEAQAEYRKRVSALPAADLGALDPVTAENFSKGLKRADFMGESSLSGVIKTARTAEFKTTAEGLLDKLGKQAGLPGADVAALNTQADNLDEIGRQAFGAGWEKRKQDWKDSNWNDHLNQKAMAARNDVKSIDALMQQITAGDYADKLDSNRRNALVARLDGYKTSLIQRQEAAAARAQRQQEAALKRAEAEFNTFQTLADKGTILDPTYIDRVVKMTAGTPYQEGIKAIARQAQETGGIAAQPIQAQQAALDAIDRQIAQQGRTPALDKRRDQLRKVLEGSQSDLTENGLRAGLERGVITELAPIDVSTPEAFAASIGKRMEQADVVGAWAGRAVSPLDAREAASIRGMLDALPAKTKSQAVATIAEAVGPRAASAIAQQIDKQDKPLALAFATAGSKTTADRYTSELILKGATAIKDGTAMKDDKKVTGWKASIAQEIDGVFPDERAASAVKDAAYYIAANIAHENGGTANTDDIKRAVRLAMGGGIIERNGKRLPVPAGVDADALDKRLRSVSADEIARQAPGGKVRVGGVEMSADEFAPTIAGQELLYAGPGRYAVIVKGRPVVNAAGRPIIIGVK